MEYLSKVLHTVEYSNTVEFRYLELGCLEILPVIYFFFSYAPWLSEIQL